MALTYSNFNTFDEVASYYERIKPLRGANNVGKDIRPIGDRKRKYERIVKVSDNCYALSDGWHYGDNIFPAWYRNAEYTPTLKDMAFYAPIVWRKHKDGTETVTMRNGSGPSAHCMRYAFLYRHSPKGLHFRNRNGKHFIQAGVSEYFLAKGDTVPKPVWEVVQREIAEAKANGRKMPRWMGWQRAKNDNASLTFKLVEGRWQHVDGGRDVPVPPRKVINKDAKAKYKQHIDAFKEWAFTMGPLLPLDDYSYIREQERVMREWKKENNIADTGWGGPTSSLDKKIKREIISSETHPMRLPMAVFMLRSVEFYMAKDEEDARAIKQRANTWINTTLDFIKTVKG